MEEKKFYTLSTILRGIRDYLDLRIKGHPFWLKVEIANINFHSTGHCYLELAETKNGQCIAQCKGAIWSSSLSLIRNTLGKDFNNILKKGNEILCHVELQFTEKFGLNIIIDEIDINFNLGFLERKKQETLERLKKENLIGKNNQIPLPTVIQKIAIIGSPETSGITDLIKQLNENAYNFCFEYSIFSCLVQGDKAEQEILNRLQQLKGSKFEVIALIRGGGSKLDLEVFNSYSIAREIALHDKPILTGIGHETDVSVADLVANKYHKTPTALGSYLVERAYEFEVRYRTTFTSIIEFKNIFFENRKSRLKLNIQSLTSTSKSYTQLRRGALHTSLNRINAAIRQHLADEQNKISLTFETISTAPQNCINNSKRNLGHTMELIRINSTGMIKQYIDNFKLKLDLVLTSSKMLCSDKLNFMNNVSHFVEVYHPKNIMNKGYAIPRFKGKLLSDQELQPGEELEIELKDRILLVSFIKIKERWKILLTNKLLRS